MKVGVSIVLFPDMKTKRQIWELMKDISRKYHTYFDISKGFTKVGPHITIVGFKDVNKKDVNKIINEIKPIIKATKPFEIKIKSIGFFVDNKQKENLPYAIYLKVIKSKMLNRLNRILKIKLEKYGKLKWKIFLPHITLAHADLTKGNFLRAKKELKTLKILKRFTAKDVKIFILKNRKWNTIKRFKLIE